MYLAALQRRREGVKIANTYSHNTSEKNEGAYGKDGEDIAVNDGYHPVTGWNISADKADAQRALRVAGWMSAFYLITTDILGPTSCPWAFSQLGYVPGFLLYFFMGIAAAYTGWQLWYMYLALDSDEFPVRSYSDLAGIIYGKTAEHVVNVLQSLQLLFNVAVIILGNGQGLSQVANASVCFSVLVLVWALAGMLVGQIRSLQNFGWLANSAIWMNLLVIFITMGVVAHSPPNYLAAGLQNGQTGTAIVTGAFIDTSFNQKIVGIMQIVYSYGGAMMFINFMAEMRRPFDFIKGMALAQIVIFVSYLMYGIFVYAYQGQYTINPANQGISNYGFQTATNVLSLVSALIAAGLYGNVGLKIVYQTIILDLLNGPRMASLAGRITWTFLVLGYWAFAFVIASAIPQFSNISSLVAAVCILQFTYTFPPLLMLGYEVQRDAIATDEYIDEQTGQPGQLQDTWSSWSRWKRGLTRRWYVKLFNFLFFLAALATACLGMYTSGTAIQEGFQSGGAGTSFTCQSPVA
ncbi:transmembrane amino acid transporter protein-domain-containing protein [Umbelopsis sp. AD052]|nr:transmembrane amino acid transporter protein-domain-containing protein [Umbelopsis sp. AD052]